MPLITPTLVLRDDASSCQKYLNHPKPFGKAKSCPEEQEAAAGCARAGFGLRIPASKTHLLTEIPAQAVTRAQDLCLPPRDAKGAWINQSGLIKQCSTPVWLISPKLRQPSFNLVSFSCKIEADKPRRWALVWISGSTQEFNVIQSLPSKLTPISLQVFVQAEPRAVARGSLGSMKQVSHSQASRVLSQQRSQQFLPSSSPSSLATASAGDRHGPHLCPPTPLPTLAAACSKGSRRSSASCCLPGTISCLVAPACPWVASPTTGHWGSHGVSSGVA